mmetsp:Transcript_3501/g.9861  ORF Transcript_3501/g.9861 Transcript_3501/m.9861 type:complete len:219 (+) Transcript_3501:968-1624(+)
MAGRGRRSHLSPVVFHHESCDVKLPGLRPATTLDRVAKAWVREQALTKVCLPASGTRRDLGERQRYRSQGQKGQEEVQNSEVLVQPAHCFGALIVASHKRHRVVDDDAHARGFESQVHRDGRVLGPRCTATTISVEDEGDHGLCEAIILVRVVVKSRVGKELANGLDTQPFQDGLQRGCRPAIREGPPPGIKPLPAPNQAPVVGMVPQTDEDDGEEHQ